MGVRETLNKRKSLGIGLAAVFLIGAAVLLTYTEWPEHHFSGHTEFYSDDDGQTWFIDSAYKTTPFDHNGKQAVRAMIYSCDNGHTKFCAYLMRFKASDKDRLDHALAEAAQAGKPPSSVSLFADKGILDKMEIKEPGAGQPWVSILGPHGADVTNAVLKDHNDGSLDIVYAE